MTGLRDGDWAGQPCLLVGGGPSAGKPELALSPFNEHGLDLFSIAVNASSLWWNVDVVVVGDRHVIEETFSASAFMRRAKGWHGTANPDGRGDEAKHFFGAEHHVFHRTDATPDEVLAGWLVVGSTGPNWSRALGDGLVHTSNTGVAALNLACLLGADPIYLLGFDCLPSKSGRTINFHGAYPSEWKQDAHTYERFIADFEKYAPEALAGGRKIVNLNPDSALKCFEFESAIPDSKDGEPVIPGYDGPSMIAGGSPEALRRPD